MIALAMVLAMQTTAPDYVAEAEVRGRSTLLAVMCWQAGVAPLDTAHVDRLFEEFKQEAIQAGVGEDVLLAAVERGMTTERVKSDAVFNPVAGDPASNERLAMEYLANSCAEVMSSNPELFAWSNDPDATD